MNTSKIDYVNLAEARIDELQSENEVLDQKEIQKIIRQNARLFEQAQELEAENQRLREQVSSIAKLLDLPLQKQRILTAAYLAEWSALKAENQRLKDANRWIPVSERLPETEGMYETTYEYGNGKRQIEKFWFDGKQFFAHYVIAWRELPEPYQGDV